MADAPPTLLTPRILVPFLVVTLIWGSTWLVIRDGLGTVPASWSVAYRFAIASVAMFALAAYRREALWLPARVQLLALGIGIPLFMMNFNFVYRAEHHLTSGVVAVIFALLIVPNTILSRIFLGTPTTRKFLAGGSIGILGIALLLAHEARSLTADPAAVALGAGLTLAGVLSASVANVVQATPRARENAGLALIAWAMLWGALADAAFAAATAGPPVIDMRPTYLAGVLYLALAGSVLCFPLYFAIIRSVGAGPAAWSSVLVPVIAMALSTAFEGYAWSGLAIAGSLLALTGLVVALWPARPAGA